ncbi:MAG: hypothetical protein IE931_03410 [Sphingobacteriales bacterium]|nr:hypothetical protein [Sphingobacteriales bacterium]
MADKLHVPNFDDITLNLFEDIAEHVAGQAISQFKGSFYKQGFTDSSFIAWPRRRDDLSHKLLRKSLDLINSILPRTVSASRVEIEAGKGLPYATAHNNGAIIKIRITARMRKFFWFMFYKTNQEKWKFMALSKKRVMRVKIPQRQFIGESQTLNKNIDKAIINLMEQNLRRVKF